MPTTDAPNSPRVSIAMGAFNCESTLSTAIDSICAQTYQSWELIICDDGSTDNTRDLAIAHAADDNRIRVIYNPTNLGLNHALNHCLSKSRGEFFARMDGDDVSVPRRIATLVNALDADQSIALVSSGMALFDENGDWGTVISKPDPDPIDFTKGTPFCHAPCMIRRAVLEELGGYGKEKWLIRAQDYHLWFRLYAAGYRGKNIPDQLYRVRDDRDASQRRRMSNRLVEARVMLHGFRMLGLPLPLYVNIFRPIALGLLPTFLYDRLRQKRRRNT